MVQKTLPWDVVLLLGGGFALADAVLVSGLNALLGDSLSVLHDLPANVVALLLMILVSVTTSVASNVATASIFVPVVAGLADSMGIHPLLFMLSATLTSSLAFVLPVSTPPNAIAFSSGRLAVMDMIKVGTCLNVLGVLAVLLVLDTFGIALYGPWEEQPAWARRAGSSPPPPLRSNVTNLACTP
jgi:sodium-dependent dicarboxylate transporter 2/3/5